MANRKHIKWVNRLQINDKVDIFDDTSNIKTWPWCYGCITDIDRNRIKTGFCGWRSKWDKWIDKINTIKKIAPLNTYTIPSIFLSDPPVVPYSNLCFYQKESKQYIIFLHRMESDDIYVIRYDMIMDKYEKIAKATINVVS